MEDVYLPAFVALRSKDVDRPVSMARQDTASHSARDPPGTPAGTGGLRPTHWYNGREPPGSDDGKSYMSG